MLRGLYTSALGMTTQMKRMDVVSNNIANVNTTGYKKDITVSSSFDEALAKRINDIEDKKFPSFAKPVGDITYGVFVDEIYTDFSQGNIITTHGTYDLSLTTGGFFVVNKQGVNGQVSELYTRDGSFTRDAEGYLVTSDGGRVQGMQGDIFIPDGTVLIEEDGSISVDGEPVDTLRLTDFEDLTTLRKRGDNYLATTNASVPSPYGGVVMQGAIEASNVNTVKEMVDLITVNRAYEANQKVVQAYDQSLQKSATEVGRK